MHSSQSLIVTALRLSCSYCLEIGHCHQSRVQLLPVALLGSAFSFWKLPRCPEPCAPHPHQPLPRPATLSILQQMLPGVLFEMDASLLFQSTPEPLGSGSSQPPWGSAVMNFGMASLFNNSIAECQLPPGQKGAVMRFSNASSGALRCQRFVGSLNYVII